MAGSPEIKAPIALTMGDPAGAGPSLAAQAWRMRSTHTLPPFIFFGSAEALRAHDRDISFKTITAVKEGIEAFRDALPVLEMGDVKNVVPGAPEARNAKAIIQSLEAAAASVMNGETSSLVTNPIYKKSLLDAGFKHPGHTGFLGKLAGATPVMMLANEHLRAVPVTVHLPLKDAVKALSKELIFETAIIVARDLEKRFRITNPRLAITGLNPHAGEEGKLGREELKIIIPAIEKLKAAGVNVEGPLPADTAFTAPNRMKYDAFLAMTHDQALIPVKALDFRGAVNITLGLPFVRTSPAHGTAFDLLRGGRTPDPESLIQALLMAARLTS